ncbi:MAG: molybdenum ABC transporter ATP-binding protein [Nevskiales bacterium]|nr:molybdenum ABC transporter ATP-binding protein [Nevskiales bacterium]
MSLQVEIVHRQGSFELRGGFDAPQGLTALFGPSGSGKTTLVRAIAGLLKPQQARIAVDGAVLVDTAAGLCLPAHRRRIGYVFQEPRLFPHFTVRQNLGYGRWFAGEAKAADDARLIDLLDIGPLLARYPGRLSGGERQRVAIGRALLSAPRLLLMDEPLSQVDAVRKAEILPYIERLRDELRIPIVYVSHALDEVVRLAGHLVCLSQGGFVAAGPTAEVLTRTDLTMFAQRPDAGAVVAATVRRHDPEYRLTELACAAGSLWVPQLGHAVGSPVRVWVRAQDVTLALQPPREVSALNVLTGTIASIGHADPSTAMVAVDCGGVTLLARVTHFSVDRLQLRAGLPVHALVKSVSFPIAGHAMS